MDISIFIRELLPYILVFSRIVGIFLFIPGFSAVYIPQRIRAGLCLMLTLVVVSALPNLPIHNLGPLDTLHWTLWIGKEVLIGVFFGLSARMIFLTFEVAGSIASMSSSLASAEMFNPASGTQSTVLSSFYSLLGIMILFVADLHHLLLGAMITTFEVFPMMAPLAIGDMTQHYILIVNQMFMMGVQLAAPVLLVGFIFSLSLAMLNRLMPSMQVFFVGMPAQIMLCFVAIALSLSSAMRLFVQMMERWSVTGQLI